MRTAEEVAREVLRGRRPSHARGPIDPEQVALLEAWAAEVRAEALREWLATWPNRYVGSPIYEDGMKYADRIEKGETDEDS